jgi:gamma-glutamyltranspeptidase/glutathione hydrolase
MVSAADPRAAEAGATILREGGSAVDAAMATMLALTVVEPQSSGIGGGGFLVTDDGKGHVGTIDGREEAPAAATPQWFFKDGKPMAFADAWPGGKSTGVPGNVRLLAMAHEKYGKLAWKRLFDPAIALARDGFAVTPRLHESLDTYRSTGPLSAESRALYYLPDGSAKPVGAIIRNHALAAFLTQLATLGPDAFYVGPNAQAIGAAVQGASVNPAPMQAGDLAAYKAVDRAPVCGTYRGYRICGMGPPSSGATSVFAILKQLERFDMGALGKDSPTAWHLIAESTRLAFADRDRYLADADVISVPVAGLTDRAYLAQRSMLISPTTTMTNVKAGTPAGAPKAFASAGRQVEYGTSHFVAVDSAGRVASMTSTIESPFGSGLMVNGYFLNNELTDFNLDPNGKDGRPTANAVLGGKRPRSSMSPTIVYAPDGSIRLAVGAAGGATIIAQVAKAIIGVIDFKLSAQDAIALPVIFAPDDTLWIEKGSALEAMRPALTALGHKDIRSREGFKANAIERVDGHWAGAADPRSEGKAISQ